jgi:hypothetical protein
VLLYADSNSKLPEVLLFFEFETPRFLIEYEHSTNKNLGDVSLIDFSFEIVLLIRNAYLSSKFDVFVLLVVVETFLERFGTPIALLKESCGEYER